MSPLQFAQQECANYDQGRCAGADVWNTTCRPLEVCLLHEQKPCPYFEACVLPLANRGNVQFIQARRTYELSNGLRSSLHKCSCGTPMPPGKRLCEECRMRNRKETYRESQRRWRSK